MAVNKSWVSLIFGLFICSSVFSQHLNVGEQIVDTASKYVGVLELTGNNDGDKVEYFISTTGLDPKGGYAWCTSFVNAVHQECGLQTPRGAAWSPSWFPEDHIIYVRGKDGNRHPEKGDVGGIWFRSKGRIAHGFIIVEWGEKWTYTIEGNTNADGSREGDGVYKKKRPTKNIHSVSRWKDKK